MNTDQLQYIGRLSFAYTKRGKKVILTKYALSVDAPLVCSAWSS